MDFFLGVQLHYAINHTYQIKMVLAFLKEIKELDA